MYRGSVRHDARHQSDHRRNRQDIVPRMRRTTKRRFGIAGLAIAALLVVLLIACARIHVMLTTVPALTDVAAGVLPTIVALDAGCMKIVWPQKSSPGAVRWMSSVVDSKRFLFQWIPDVTKNRVSGFWNIRLPLWIPAILIAAPSFLLWRRNPKQLPKGFCVCGYDLTGNESGKCPECGKEI